MATFDTLNSLAASLRPSVTPPGWKTRYQQASFRGVPFAVVRHETELGQQTVVHEYPQRDAPWTEDMGKRARRYQVRALVIGPDYDQARDRLVAAFEAPGPGVLIHPAYGRVIAKLDGSVRISENPTREGGLAEISVTFVESGENITPGAETDTASLVESAAEAAKQSALEDFLGTFNIEGLPDFSLDGAIETVNDVITIISTPARILSTGISLAGGFTQLTNRLINSVKSLISLPSSLAGSLTGLVGGLAGLFPRNTASGSRAMLDVANSVSTAPLPYIDPVTPQRKQELDNRTAITDLVERTAVAEAAEAQTETDYETTEEAEKIRDELVEAIDKITDAPETPEAVYRAFVVLRAAVVRDMTERAIDLPRLRTVTLPETLPAVVVAHRLLGDATRADEIVSRNRLPHPGFVPGGQPLEIAP